jgi:hypothetical protein
MRRTGAEPKLFESQRVGTVPRVFISYSRRDFYAAEQVVTTLRRDGIDPWLDVERLASGANWNASIERAIDSADAFVLLASRSAVDSSHVRDEWRRARLSGTPIYVAIVQNIDMPAELSDRPTVDLRSRFDSGMVSLSRALVDPTSHLPISPPATMRWSIQVALVAVALGLVFCAGLGCVVLAALTVMNYGAEWLRSETVGNAVDQWPAVVGICLVSFSFLLYLGSTLRAFVTRSFAYRSLWITLLGGALFVNVLGNVTSSLADFLAHGGNLVLSFTSGSNNFLAFRATAILVLLPVSLVALTLLIRSPALLRWLPTGEAPFRMRQRVLDQTVGYGAKADTAAGTFAVRSIEADQVVADDLRRTFQAAGLTEAAEPDISLVIVSNMTPLDWLKHSLSHPGALAVLATSARIPREVTELRRQWVDYRDGDRVKMAVLARSLHDSEQRQVAPVPRALDRFDAPPPIRGAVGVLLSFVALFLGSAAFSFAGAQQTAEDRHYVSFEDAYIPDPGAVTSDGRHKTFEEVLCEQLGWPATTSPSMPDCTALRQQPPHDAFPWERPRIPDPKYVNRFPTYANTLFFLRAALAMMIGLLIFAGLWLIARRRIRPPQLHLLAAATLVLLAGWIVAAAFGREQPVIVVVLYAVAWLVSLGIVLSTRPLIAWLPAARPDRRMRRAAVSPPLIRASTPVVLLVLMVMYAGGTVL